MAKLKRIRIVLAERDLINKWLPDKFGKDLATVSKWVTNTTQPSLEALIAIANIGAGKTGRIQSRVINRMMTIEKLLARKESPIFDYKSIQIAPKVLAIPIVAMANVDGGVLAIGVSDKTLRIEGVDENEERQNELLQVPLDYCNPSVKVKCEYLPFTEYNGNKNRILLIHIPASSQLHTNQADECFMRVGEQYTLLRNEHVLTS